MRSWPSAHQSGPPPQCTRPLNSEPDRARAAVVDVCTPSRQKGPVRFLTLRSAHEQSCQITPGDTAVPGMGTLKTQPKELNEQTEVDYSVHHRLSTGVDDYCCGTSARTHRSPARPLDRGLVVDSLGPRRNNSPTVHAALGYGQPASVLLPERLPSASASHAPAPARYLQRGC